MKSDLTKTILLTGLHRSGTSLICQIMGFQKDVVALNEPIDFSKIHQASTKTNARDIAINLIDEFVQDTYLAIANQLPVWSKAFNGKLSSNMFEKFSENNNSLRKEVQERILIQHKSVSAKYHLIIKHPAAFTALLPYIEFRKYLIFAVIRNPVFILCSWNSCDLNIRIGRAPIAEAMDENLSNELANENNIKEKQLIILRWFYNTYAQNLSKSQIIRYEDLFLKTPNEIPLLNSFHIVNIVDEIRLKESVYPTKYINEALDMLNKLDDKDPVFSFYDKHAIKRLF